MDDSDGADNDTTGAFEMPPNNAVLDFEANGKPLVVPDDPLDTPTNGFRAV